MSTTYYGSSAPRAAKEHSQVAKYDSFRGPWSGKRGPLPELPWLPCPECKMRGLGGGRRIGNARSVCTTCNNFVRNVTRTAGRVLREQYHEEYLKLRLEAELALYPQVIEDFNIDHPVGRAVE